MLKRETMTPADIKKMKTILKILFCIMKNFFCPYKIWFEPICFQVLWQFGMFAAEPLTSSACPIRAAHSAARTEFRSSYFKNTPPIRISQARGSRLASLGGQFVLFLERKRKGFINNGKCKRNFLSILVKQKYEIHNLR